MEYIIIFLIIIKMIHYIISKAFEILNEWEYSQCFHGNHDYIPTGIKGWKCKKCGKKM